MNQEQIRPQEIAPKKSKVWLWAVIVLIILIIIVTIVYIKKPDGAVSPNNNNVAGTGDITSTTVNENTAKLSFDSAGVSTDPFNDPNGPFFHNVYKATSTDGLNFTKNENILIEKASVPDAVKTNDGTIFVYAVDGARRSQSGIMVARSKNNGETWEMGSVKFSSPNPGGADPQAILLDDGRIRLFYVTMPLAEPGQPLDPSSKNQVLSAISSNGINFTPEDGKRFEYDQITDPDVIKIGEIWFMYAAQGPKQIYATSTDGMTFLYKGLIRNQGSVSKTVPIDSGKYRQYFCKSGIASATTSDGTNWQDDSGLRIVGSGDAMVCDPSPVKTESGWLMFYKIGGKSSEPVPAAPSSLEPQPIK